MLFMLMVIILKQITLRELIRKGLKPKIKNKKKGNPEIIVEQREVIMDLESKVERLRGIVDQRNEEIADLEERIAEIQANQ